MNHLAGQQHDISECMDNVLFQVEAALASNRDATDTDENLVKRQVHEDDVRRPGAYLMDPLIGFSTVKPSNSFSCPKNPAIHLQANWLPNPVSKSFSITFYSASMRSADWTCTTNYTTCTLGWTTSRSMASRGRNPSSSRHCLRCYIYNCR